MNTAPTLLLVDDEPDLTTLYATALQRRGWQCLVAANVTQAKHLLDTQPSIGAVLTDMRMPDGTGMDVLRYAKQQHMQLPVTVITAFSDVAGAGGAVDAMKAGAFDYLTKPVDLTVLRTCVQHMLEQPRPSAQHIAQSDAALNDCIENLLPGASDVMQAVKAQLRSYSFTHAPIVIHGESGTGKELAARALHQCSSRKNKPFIAVNCGAIPEQLMEAEFFGVRKGAYTGAHADRDGFFQAAQGGTLLLDEVTDLPLSMQVKLLRVLQERSVRRIGDTVESHIDVRIISASHKPLSQHVEKGLFRQDLYYRLNVMSINMPPLRLRGEDILFISTAWLSKHPQGKDLHLNPDAQTWLLNYAYPGNVRELENILERAVALCRATKQHAITPQHLHHDSADTATPAPPLTPLADISTPNVTVAASQQAPAHGLQFPIQLTQHLADIEKQWIEAALIRTRYNRTAAAALLGISLRQLRYRIAQLGLE